MAPKTPTISLTEMADEMGVTTRTIQNYVRDGMPHRHGPRFVAKECHRWRREKEVAEARQQERDKLSADGLDKDQETAEKTRVERQIKEVELLVLRGRKIDVDVHRERIETFVGGMAAVTLGQLQHFERDIVQANDAVAARRVTTRIQAALMKGAQDYADALEAEMAALEPAEESA